MDRGNVGDDPVQAVDGLNRVVLALRFWVVAWGGGLEPQKAERMIMAYTLKRSLNGLTLEDIKRIYDNNPNMTLRELSNLTGLAVPFLKKILLEQAS